MIPTRNYWCSDVLAMEGRQLFSRGWQFVGFTDELANHRDFIVLELPGHSIVVQNFDGRLRAFRNVCTHRFNKIQIEDRGNRHLTCRYHNWTYDETGAPRGASERLGFGITPEERQKLCLRRYSVQTAGRFVFVSLEESPQPLSDYLGGFDAMLRDLSNHIGKEIYFGTVPIPANWKLHVENVVECYHCWAVHPETFVAGLGVGRKPIEKVEVAGPHSSCHFPRVETKREHLRKRVLSHLDARGFSHDSFFHVYVFPNFFISSTEGSSFLISQILPVSATESVLRVRMFEPSVELTENQRFRQDAINAQTVELGLRVIDEDRRILEHVQKGIMIATTSGALGADEVRIAAFMDSYMEKMRSDAPEMRPRLAG